MQSANYDLVIQLQGETRSRTRLSKHAPAENGLGLHSYKMGVLVFSKSVWLVALYSINVTCTPPFSAYMY